MKCTTSWAALMSNTPSVNGSRSAAAQRTSIPGNRACAAATNDSDGSTADTAAGAAPVDQCCGQRAGSAADVQHALAPPHVQERDELVANGSE